MTLCSFCGPIEKHKESWDKFLLKRDRALARKRLLPEDYAMIAKLDGLSPGLKSFTASNRGGRGRLAHEVTMSMRKAWENDALLSGVHITIMLEEWTTSGESTVLDLAKIVTNSNDILAHFGNDWSAAVEWQAYANVAHPLGGKLVTPHGHIIMIGRNIIDHAKETAKNLNAHYRAPLPAIEPIAVRPIGNEWQDWANVVRYPLKGIDKNKTRYIHPETGQVDIHESEKGDRFIRYLRLYQLMSLVRQKDMLFASGAGAELQRTALKRTVRALSSEGLVGGDITIRQVRSFWAELMLRLGWDRFQLPTIIRPSS
jgi:hypothetical protein